jgi:CRP/FNR family cyclic AMP-dependent transcriptional regulator
MDRTYQPNELIFEEGDASDFAYIIRSGEVEILRDYPENPLRLAVLRVGDVFGEMGLIDERPRSLTARAISETRLSTVTRDGFIDLLQNDPQEALKYLRMFFERLRAMNARVGAGEEVSEQDSVPKKFEVTIFPLSPTAERFVPQQGFLLKAQTFRVGRSSGRHEDPLEINDLILHDSPPYNVSRNHFSIEQTSVGVFVHDRGSFLGTIVNDEVIGGHHHGATIMLGEGDNEIIAGSHHSPFRFRVAVKSS